MGQDVGPKPDLDDPNPPVGKLVSSTSREELTHLHDAKLYEPNAKFKAALQQALNKAVRLCFADNMQKGRRGPGNRVDERQSWAPGTPIIKKHMSRKMGALCQILLSAQ